jgi:thiol-disulfide isomerase/thioredoxin
MMRRCASCCWRRFLLGRPFIIHSKEELSKFLDTYKDRLVILEAKATHCKPCKKFAATYNEMAARFSSCVFLEVYGDENPETRKMMVSSSAG